jgi:hypothetical protein
MQAISSPTTSYPMPHNAQEATATRATSNGHAVNPMTLARLDLGLFRALNRLGTSSERICSALCISHADFEYIRNLSEGMEM